MADIDGRTARTAQRRKPGRNGLTAAKRKLFLATLADTCNVTAAARIAGISAGNAYHLRLRDGEFAQLWAAAMETGYLRLEAALLERAGGAHQPDNPALGEVLEGNGTATALDVDLALKLLARRREAAPGRRAGGGAPLRAPDPAQIQQALERKIAAIERRLEKRR